MKKTKKEIYQHERKERRKYVKEQREKLKGDPKGFIQSEVIDPTVRYWKERPGHAIFTFFKWVIIYYLIFGAIQAVNNDMIYCNSTIDKYDGKVMDVFNDFAEQYNKEAEKLAKETQFVDPTIRESIIKEFYEDNTIRCKYDLKRWNEESIRDRFISIIKGYWKIISKS